MTENDAAGEQKGVSWQLQAGIGLFVISIIVPLAGIPLVSCLNFSTATTALTSGALLVGSELIGIIAIALMGKAGYQVFKKQVSRFFRQYGPPQKVSRLRYTTGLCLFITPIMFGWLSVYISGWIPYYPENPVIFAVIGDLLFVTSLFVLGGDFWDKVRSLFIHNSEVIIQKKPL